MERKERAKHWGAGWARKGWQALAGSLWGPRACDELCVIGGTKVNSYYYWLAHSFLFTLVLSLWLSLTSLPVLFAQSFPFWVNKLWGWISLWSSWSHLGTCVGAASPLFLPTLGKPWHRNGKYRHAAFCLPILTIPIRVIPPELLPWAQKKLPVACVLWILRDSTLFWTTKLVEKLYLI